MIDSAKVLISIATLEDLEVHTARILGRLGLVSGQGQDRQIATEWAH